MSSSLPVEALTRIVGSDRLVIGAAAAPYAVDGVMPTGAVFPDTIEEVSQILALAGTEGMAVLPRGAGTKTNLGNPPARPGLVLGLERMCRVLAYEADDMTASVQPGITVDALNAHLAEGRQFLPADVPFSDRATLGGVAATNAAGPLRQAYLTMRTIVIGMTVVQADGSVAKSGGMVVKNATGYDLCKLYIGSLGTLGVIVSLNLKVQPLPAERATVVVDFPDAAALAVTAQVLLDAHMALSFMEAANPDMAHRLELDGAAGYRLIVGVDGTSDESAWQAEEIDRIGKAHGAVRARVLTAEAGDAVRRRVRDYPALAADGVILRITALSTRYPDLAAQVPEAAGNGAAAPLMLSSFGSGVHRLLFPGPVECADGAVRQWHDRLRRLEAAAGDCGGRLVIEAAPPEIKQGRDVWGPPRPEWEIMKDIKRALDPNGILNPGRFVGGL